jgi:hypothetical protein
MLGTTRLEMGNKKGLLVTAGSDGAGIYFEKMDSAIVNPKYLQDFVGQYYSQEAEAMYHIVVDGGKLLLKIKPTTTFILTPTYKDAFDCPFGPVYFVRDLKRGIMELKISVGRARNVLFRAINTATF